MRFPGFQGEWIEEKVGDVALKVNSGKTPLGGEAVYSTNGILFLRSQNVNNDRLNLQNSVFISEKINNGMKNSLVQANDILLNITGASLGRSCVVPSDFKKGNVNQHVCIVRLDNKHDPRFLQPIFSSKKGQNNFESLQTGSGREGLNFESIKNIKNYFPSFREQKKIAAFLSLVEERINTQSKIIEGFIVLNGLVSKKIFNQQFRFKGSERKDFQDWEIKNLGDIGEVINGLTYNPKDVNGDGVLVLRSSNVQDRMLTFDDNVFVNARNFNAVIEDDILICVRNGSRNLIGKNAIIKKEHEGLAFGAFMAVYRSIYNKFLTYWFNSEYYKEEVHKNLGATINSINGSDLKKFKVPLPSVDEQTKIASFLFNIQSKIETEKSILEQLELQKKYLLQQMFV